MMSVFETQGKVTGEGAGVQRGLGCRLVALAGLLAVVGLIALLAWGLARSGSSSGGFAINAQLGEVAIRPGPARPFRLTTFEGQTLALDDLRGRARPRAGLRHALSWKNRPSSLWPGRWPAVWLWMPVAAPSATPWPWPGAERG